MNKDWQEGAIDPESLAPNPVDEFLNWYGMATESDDALPEAMSLATVTREGTPTVRVVLMRGCDERGVSFFTNYESPKCIDMEANPQVALAFHWKPIFRQIRVEGRVSRVPEEESKIYWDSRPRGSRLAGWASKQSAEVDAWGTLAERVEQLEEQYPDDDIPLPPFWGGYIVEPSKWEFWLSRESRLHDRFVYEKKDDDEWKVVRLQP